MRLVIKAEKGEQVSGHKYLERTPDGKGGWNYRYRAGYEATIRPHSKLGMHPTLSLKVTEADDEHARVSISGSAVRVSHAALAHLQNDLEGRVTAERAPEDDAVAAVTGHARSKVTFLGKGDDGLAFRVGGEVVKVSTVASYNLSTFRTPEGALKQAREQHETQQAMRDAGVPNLLPERFVEHEGRGYTIKPYVEVPDKLTAAQLDTAHDAIEAMHGKGYVLGDTVQIGLLGDRAVLFDVGKAHKSESEQCRADDREELAQLYRKNGVEFTPRGEPLDREWHRTLAFVSRLPPKTDELRDKMAKKLSALAEAKRATVIDDLDREIIDEDLSEALKKLDRQPKVEKAMRFVITANLDSLKKARKLHRRREFRGLQISVENQTGSIRHWYDPHTKKHGQTRMLFDYGYVRRTEGTDGDHVDVYVGPDKDASFVFVIDQLKAPDFVTTDEQKCMLGFANLGAAVAAYQAHYGDPRFLGQVRAVAFEDFAAFVLEPKNHGALIKGYAVQRYSPSQEMPDFEGVYGTAQTEKEAKASARRRKALARRNSGRYAIHGAAPKQPEIRYRVREWATIRDAEEMGKR